MHRVQVMDDPTRWTLGHGLGLQLVRSGDRVFFGHGGAMPGFLAMLLGRRKEGDRRRRAHERLDAGAAVEEICLDLAEKALELYHGRAGAVAPRARSRRPRSPSCSASGGRKGRRSSSGGSSGTLRARPTESDKPRHVLDLRARRRRPRSASPRAASAASSCASCATATASIEKLYWATYPVTRDAVRASPSAPPAL